MGKRFGGKRGLKRHTTPDKFEARAPARNRRRVEDEVDHRELSGEESSGGASEELNYKELTAYDKLLSKLSSSNRPILMPIKRVSEEEKGFEETDSDSLGLQEPAVAGTEKQTEDNLETSDTDEDDDLILRSPTVATVFTKHVEYKLSKVEADDLSKKKWKYAWELPAADISNCKWVGTGECFLKV
ncbi:F11A6.3 protein, putative isoform 3 [Hibiscus syriacus]|uniref:F11A6.3 protein, putative isoform 3 n=1 Tax=Hibiscus syriacus TaxID=106335 RepID=A0A6A3BCR4_HIBSY|nr:F11A6.3 protein, putative isoform 3 [Hibiscus syriacus]